MNSFDHMVMALNKTAYDAAIHSTKTQHIIRLEPSEPIKTKISKNSFEEFLKDFTFERLKDRPLAECFLERFQVSDLILGLNISDDLAMTYIKQYYIE